MMKMFQTTSHFMRDTLSTTEGTDELNSNNVPFGLEEDKFISDAAYYKIQIFVNGFIPFTISIVGISTNLINGLMFQRQGLKDRMNLCLFFLATADVLYSSTVSIVSLMHIVCHFGMSGFDEGQLLKNVIILTVPMYGFRAVSACYTMVIAVERCLCVIFPLRALSLLKTRTMTTLLVCIAGIVLLGFATVPMKYIVVGTVVAGEVRWHLEPSKLYLNNMLLFDTILENMLGISLPFATCFFVSMATVVTVLKLRAAILWREKTVSSNTATGKQIALTKMLVAVSCAYIISMIPFVLVAMATLAVPEFSTSLRYANVFAVSHNVVNWFPLMNSSVNFYIYYSLSSRFKRDLKSVLQVVMRSSP